MYWTSDIYIRRPIYISDIRYLYLTSDIYIRHPISISDVRYLYSMSDIPALALAEVGYCILDVGYIYWTSDIDFRNIGVILSQTVPHRPEGY